MSATLPVGPGLAARLARNSLHSASGRVVAMVAWLALTPWLVRALGAEGFAVWSLTLALTGWLGSLDVGLSHVALRFGAAARTRGDVREAGEYATLAALGYLALGGLWLVVVLAARAPLLDLLRLEGAPREQASLAFSSGAAIFTAAGLATTTASVLQAWDRFDLANAVNLTASLTQVAGVAAALATGQDLPGALVALAAGWLAGFVVGAVLLARAVPGFRWAAPAAAATRARAALRFGLPLQLANVAGVTHQQLGKFLLVRFVTLTAVVPYELGLRVTTAATTFAQLVLGAMVPEAAALHARADVEGLAHLHRRAGRVVTGVAAALTAALVASAEPLLAAWLGSPQPQAALALRLLAVAAYAGVAGGVTGAIARGAGRTRLELEWSGLALVLHAGLAFVWVPRFGLVGALWAVAVANLLATPWFTWRLSRALGWREARLQWEPWLLPPLAAAIGARFALLEWVRFGAPWAAALFTSAVAALVTLLVLRLTRHLDPADLRAALVRGGER